MADKSEMASETFQPGVYTVNIPRQQGYKVVQTIAERLDMSGRCYVPWKSWTYRDKRTGGQRRASGPIFPQTYAFLDVQTEAEFHALVDSDIKFLPTAVTARPMSQDELLGMCQSTQDPLLYRDLGFQIPPELEPTKDLPKIGAEVHIGQGIQGVVEAVNPTSGLVTCVAEVFGREVRVQRNYLG
jgi:hypothetical protein